MRLNDFFHMINKDQFTTVEKLYKDKFALVIDLRSNPDKNKTAPGKKIVLIHKMECYLKLRKLPRLVL